MLESNWSNTIALEFKILKYLKEKPIWGIYGLAVLAGSIMLLFLLIYIFFLRYGVQPFDDSTLDLLHEVSIIETSLFLIFLIFFYLLSVSFLSNFFYAIAHYSIFNNSSFFVSLRVQFYKVIEILNYSCFYTAMFFVEDNFIEMTMYALVEHYGHALGVDLEEEDIIAKRVSGMLLVLTIISVEKINLKLAIVKSGRLLRDKLGINGELKPNFSFMTWDFSLFCITILASLLHYIFWSFVSTGAAFVSFFITLQILLGLSRLARAIFSHVVYKYCAETALTPYYSELVKASYTSK